MQKEPTEWFVEILSTGDELNRGEVVDSNAAWLAAQMTRMGWKVRFRQGLNDNREDIRYALMQAVSRSALVLVTGGLGPTEDDLTVDVVSDWAGVPPVVDATHAQQLADRIGHALAPIQQRSTRIPAGAYVLHNRIGSAPGFAVAVEGAHVLCFPGVPGEMRPMFVERAIPYIQARYPDAAPYQGHVFRVFGLSESQISTRLQDLIPTLESVGTIHYRWAYPEVVFTWVVPTSQAASLVQWVPVIRSRLAPFVYNEGEEELPKIVVKTLAERQQTLAVAESCTGGWLGQLITGIPGSSACFVGGVLAYSNAVKEHWLRVPRDVLTKQGAVSEACVRAMATHLREDMQTTYALAISGIAGPGGGTKEKPVGTVHLALATPEQVMVQEQRWHGERDMIRIRAAWAALDLLDRALRNR